MTQTSWTRAFSAHFYRSKVFWLSFLFVLYSIFGWVIVPKLIEDNAKQILSDQAAWDIEFSNIVFNPYALSLELEGTQVNDKIGPVFSFDRFYVNFGLLASAAGALNFSEISLESPEVWVHVDADGKTNFEKAFPPLEDTPEDTAEEESGEPIKLEFGEISLSQGAVQFKDDSQGDRFELEVSPISLSLVGFATHQNDDGDYALNINLGDETSIEWSGQIGIAPLSSEGSLRLNQIQIADFWHYGKQHSPYWLESAVLNVEGEYTLAQQDSALSLIVEDTQLDLSQIDVKSGEQDPTAIAISSIGVGPIAFDLEQSSLSLGEITIDQPVITASRAADGSINLAPEQGDTQTDNSGELADTPEAQASEAEQPFKWALSGVKLNSGQVIWQDNQLVEPLEISIDDIGIDLGAISHLLDQAFPYNMALSIAGSNHGLKGEAAISPLSVSGGLSIQELPLSIAQNYVSETTYIDVAGGLFSLNGDYQLAQSETLALQFQGDTRLAQLNLKHADQGSNIVGWEDLSIGPIDFNLDPFALKIDEVGLVAPYAAISISDAGKVNVASLTKASETESAEEETLENSQVGEAEADSATPQDIQLSNIVIEKGRFDFSDLSQNPPFKTYINDIHGRVAGLSSDVEAQSDVSVKGNLEDFGALDIAGTLNPLSAEPNTDLGIAVSNIDLSIISTYGARYLGYPVDQGKMNLDLNYAIDDRKLKAKNHILIDQLELGSSVDSPDSLGLPLPLALGLLKDTSGAIDIDLPVSGDLDDPSFSIGGVVVTAFVNLITKAVTAPFSLLGSLVEGGDELSTVHFEPGEITLTPSESLKVNKLAEALKARPNLNLELRGVGHETLDVLALKEQQLAKLMSLPDGVRPSVAQLEERFSQQQGAAALAALKSGQAPPEGNATDYRQNLLKALSTDLSVEPVQLISLAKARANAIIQQLSTENQIPASRIFNKDAELVNHDADKVDITFAIGTP